MATHHHDDAPEKRYVQLHRIIEAGQATDATWDELTTVAYRLGYISEAIDCVEKIERPDHKLRREQWLVQKGVLEKPSGVYKAVTGEIVPTKPQKQSRRLKGSTFQEEVVDSGAFLFLEHLPFTVMAVTLTFPLVVGMGGMFTAGTGAWIFPAIALLPVLCILGVVGSLAHQILTESAHGYTDPPRIAEFPQLVRRSLALCKAGLVCMTLLLVPGVALFHFLGTAWLGVLAAGALLFPFALGLCVTREDLRGLHPAVLGKTLWRIGLPAGGATIVTLALFAPAAAAFVFTDTSPLFLRLSLIGPLAIAPMLISSRLIGRILYLCRDRIEELMWSTPHQVDAERHDPTVQTYRSGVVEAMRETPVEEETVAERPQASASQVRRRAQGPRRERPVHPERQPAAQQQPQQRKPQQRRQQPVAVDDVPAPIGLDMDSGFENQPGFQVLTGNQRVQAGAAAQRPR